MKKSNFTLIEVMGVIALIFILLAIGTGVYLYAWDSSREKATVAAIARTENGINMLQSKNLLVKTVKTEGGSKTTAYVKIIFDAANKKLKFGDTEISSDGYKIFARAINADNVNDLLGNDNEICDAWGGAMLIRYPGKFNKGGFDLICPGPDGKFGSEATDLPPETISKYKDEDNDVICDDIANFL